MSAPPPPGAPPRRYDPRGEHCLADLWGVAPALLRDPAPLMAHLDEALRAAGLRVLSARCERFEGEGAGFTALFALAESHASAHTYPEHGYVALDLFTCGAHPARPVLEAVCARLAPEEVRVWVVARGGRGEARGGAG